MLLDVVVEVVVGISIASHDNSFVRHRLICRRSPVSLVIRIQGLRTFSDIRVDSAEADGVSH